MPVLLNLFGFVWCWLVLLMGAFHGYVGPAILLFACWAGLHFYYSKHRRSDLRLMLIACAIGPLADALLLNNQLVEYTGQQGPGVYPPVWIVAMWANFALILNHSMRWLQRYRHIFGLLGLLFGPLAYLFGNMLGGVKLLPPLWPALLSLAVSWFFIWHVLGHFMSPCEASHAATASRDRVIRGGGS